MAKSLRSSSKLKARNQKRTNPKSDYAVAEAARLAALSARLTANAKPSDDQTTAEDEIAMKDDADAEQKPKISTSGPRNSRREEYRTSKGLKPFKNKGGNSLFDAHKSKNGGKPKRRR